MKTLTNDEKILELFQSVLDVEPGRRAEFLAICAENSSIVAEVKSLLVAGDKARIDDFLVAPIFEVFAPEETRIGKSLGHYKIVSELGAGGMGEVFYATRDDGEFAQQVAVKLIKGGFNTKEMVRRFRNERQILAALEHPNIARLLDGGTHDDGLPFLVMEYVAGIPVDEFCREKNLSVEEKLILFRKICAAVSHAHRNLIIHRDLKPSNILVTKDGEPKLLDFGIAKLFSTDKPQTETMANFRALTPAYASPEQLRGEKLTTATDIYSLGVILYQLLTGTPPFEIGGKSFAEVLRLVSESEPMCPSDAATQRQVSTATKNNTQPTTNNGHTANPKSNNGDSKFLKGDIDKIVLKSLKKESERRYLSVEQFSEDIRRHLEGLPVLARADTFAYRAQKFTQRNQISVIAAALLFLAIIGGLAATLWEFRQAQIERSRAERRFNDVRALVNTFLTELNGEMVKVSGNTHVRELLVRRTLEYLDKVSQETGGDTLLKRELATGYNKIGDIQGNSYHQNLGDTSGALISYQKALEIYEQLIQENPSNAEIKSELAQTYGSIGDVLWDKGDLNATLENYTQATKMIEDLSAAAPDDIEKKLLLAEYYASLGDLKYSAGSQSFKDMPASLEKQYQALAIREQLLAANPEDRKLNTNVDQSYQRLAKNYRVVGNFAEEFNVLQKSEKIVEKFLALDPENPTRKREVAVCDARFVTYFLDADELEMARKYVEKSLSIRESMYNSDKTDVRAQRDLSFGYLLSGNFLTEKGDARGALENYRKHFKIYESLALLDASNHDRQRDLVDSLIDVGNALVKTGENSAALTNFNRALEISQKFLPDDLQAHNNLASIYQGIASALLENGDSKTAIENFQKAIQLYESEVESDKVNVVARAELAKIYFKMGKAVERDGKNTARDWYQKSLDVWNILQAQNVLRKIDLKNFEETKRALTRL